MRKNIKRFVKLLIISLLVLVVVFVGQSYFFRRYDANATRISGFYLEENDTLDVVFIGASDIFAGFSSALAYRDYGFTSYPVATDSNPVSLLDYELKDVIDFQNPQLIVIEVNSVLYGDDETIKNEDRIHMVTDSSPLTKNKVETVFDNATIEDKLSVLFPFLKYHGNWSDIETCMKVAQDEFSMKQRGYSLLKGNFTNTGNTVSSNYRDASNENRKIPLVENLEKEFVDFLEYCKSEKIENILFVRFPHVIATDDSYERVQRTNTLSDLIKDYGYDFLNYERNYKDIGLDFKNDFYNDDHLNIYGQVKMTKFLSEVLISDYGVKPSSLTEKQKRNWDICAEYYDKFYKYVDDQMKAGISEGFYETNLLIEKLEEIK